MVKISSKSEVFDFSGRQKPPIREFTIIERSWNYGNLPYLVANTYRLDFIKIGGMGIFRGGRSPLEGGGGVKCDLRCLFSNLAELFQSKVMCENLVQIGWAFQELSCPQTFFRGGINSLLGGLHLTCDARFRTRMSYSSQKSCVKIWFWLVEIGGMLMLRGRKIPY